MKNIRIAFMGSPEFSKNVLARLIDENFNIVLVISQPDKEIGRKRILSPTPVKEYALSHNIPVITPKRIRKEYEEIFDYKPDLIITCAYGQIIPEELLNYPKYECINTHASLLPKYRGGAPIQKAIINGEEKTGITLMYMSKGMDEGDIIIQEELAIDIKDTNSSLFNKLSIMAGDMLIKYLPKIINGEMKRIAQNHEEATYAYNLNKEDEFISFNDDVLKVYNHIRGLLDNPGAYSIIDNKKYKWMDIFFEYDNNTNPNEFVGLFDNYLRIDCLNGYIKVYKLKPEGKNEMEAKAFFNGSGRTLVGKKFIERLDG